MKSLIFAFSAVSMLFFITGCDNSISENGNKTGKISVKITDDPFDINSIESATVTITKIEVRKANDTVDNPFVVLSEDTTTVNLVDLRNGVTKELANIDVPVGEYNLVRIYVTGASLSLKNSPEPFNVKVPSGQQTGIKIFIKPSIVVSGGLTSDLLLDFDLSKSFVMKGHNNGFNFKPVIRAANVSTTGSVAGKVTDSAQSEIAGAKIWIEQDTVISTTFSDSIGNYAIAGIPAGTYSLFAVADAYDTAMYKGVSVTEGNRTTQDIIMNGE